LLGKRLHFKGGTPPDMLSTSISSVTGSWVTTGVYAPKKIYVLELVTNDGGVSSNCVYDLVDGAWLSAQGMPSNRVEFGLAVVDDCVYVMGGSLRPVLEGYFYPELSALNEQYVPIGYDGSSSSSSEGDSSSVFSEPLWDFLTVFVIVIMVLLAGVVVICLFFYLRRKK